MPFEITQMNDDDTPPSGQEGKKKEEKWQIKGIEMFAEGDTSRRQPALSLSNQP